MITNTIGAKLREMREKSGINQQQMAQKIGVSPSTLSDIEHDKNDVKFSHVVAICAELKVDLNMVAGISHEGLEALFGASSADLVLWRKYYDLDYRSKKKVRDEIEFLHEIRTLDNTNASTSKSAKADPTRSTTEVD